MEIKKNIKVCFFSPESYPYFWPDEQSQFGGAEFQLFLLAKYLSENENFKVLFILANYGSKMPEYFGSIKIIKGFKLPHKEPLFIKFFKALYLFILLIKMKPDVVFTTSANSITGLVAWFKKIAGYKHIHRSAHLMDVDGSWIKKNGITGKIYHYGLKHADRVVCQNKEHCGLLKINHQIEASELKNAFEITERKLVPKKHILWVARFQTWKNPGLFIDLAAKLPDIDHIMICSYTENEYKEWEKMVKRADAIKNLKILGKIRFCEIQEYFDSALIFINTSSAEGFPNTFLQAAAAKTPIVSLNVNPDGFISKYHCGVCCNNDFNLLVQSVNELLTNRQEMQLMGENAYNYLIENHDIKPISQELKEIIEKLLC